MQTKEIKKIEKEIVPIITKASKTVIASDKDMVKAVEMLSELNKANDKVQTTKKTITDPANAVLKATRALFKPIEEKLETAISSLRTGMTDYQTDMVRKQKAEEAKIASQVTSGKIKIETAVKKMENIEKAEESVVTDSGLVKFKTVKRFRVTDLKKLPIDYHLANEVEIRKQMLAGFELPGCEYYEEQIPLNFR